MSPPRSLVTSLADMTEEACERLVHDEVLLTIRYGGPREAHEASRALTGGPPHGVAVGWIREIHARHARRGLSPELAYVNVVVPVTRATLAAGARAVVDDMVELGVVYAQLQRALSNDERLACPPEAFLEFFGETARLVLERNVSGTLLVEKRLALHLETLLSASGRPPPTRLPALLPQSCASCPYDPFCGTEMLRLYLADDPMDRQAGTDWCKASMGTFDLLLNLMRSSSGPELERVYRTWMRARDRVAERLRGR